MQRMRWFAVERSTGNDNRKHVLSLVSPTDLSVTEDVDLPVDENTHDIGSCDRLLYLLDKIAKIVVWDSATKSILVVLPPPPCSPRREGRPPGFLIYTGLGYDAKSRDYKLLRYYAQPYDDPLESDTEDSDSDSDSDSDTEAAIVPTPLLSYCTDLYSVKCGTWKKLESPIGVNFSFDIVGVYLARTGRCYWSVIPGPLACKGKYVQSFDFASETYHLFPFPENRKTVRAHKLVEFRGMLGLIYYSIPALSWPQGQSVEVFATSPCILGWQCYYDVSLDNSVERPLGFKDDRWLFMSTKLSDDESGIVVYDLVTKTSKKLNISNRRRSSVPLGVPYGETTCISYAEATDPVTTMISTTPSEQKQKQKQEEKKENEEEKEKEKLKIEQKEEWGREKEREKEMKWTQVAAHSRICSRVKALKGNEKVEHLSLMNRYTIF